MSPIVSRLTIDLGLRAHRVRLAVRLQFQTNARTGINKNRTGMNQDQQRKQIGTTKISKLSDSAFFSTGAVSQNNSWSSELEIPMFGQSGSIAFLVW